MTRPHPQRSDEYLQHIVGAIDNIESYIAGMAMSDFKAERKTQDAVVRNLEGSARPVAMC